MVRSTYLPSISFHQGIFHPQIYVDRHHAGEIAESLGLRPEASTYYSLLIANTRDASPLSSQALAPARSFR
jgi:hypothetical protein